MDKRQAGNPKEHPHMHSQGEGPILKGCNRCQQLSHTRLNYQAHIPTESLKSKVSSKDSKNMAKANVVYKNSEILIEGYYYTFDLNE